MTSTTRRLAGAALALTLAGCGGGNSGTTPTTLPPTTTLPPCTQTVLFSAPFSLPPSSLNFLPFTTTQTGRLDIFLDWTFDDSFIGVYVTPTNTCRTAAQINAGCNFLIASEDAIKPRKVSAHNVAPGTYDLMVLNLATRKEAISSQGFLRSETCPAFSAVPPVANARRIHEATSIASAE